MTDEEKKLSNFELLQKCLPKEGLVYVETMSFTKNTQMTDAEKLQKLVELAWKNGYEHLKDELDAPFKVENFSGCSIEGIIFDKTFIQALCKGKYGNDGDKYAVCALCGGEACPGARSRQHDWEAKTLNDPRNGIILNDDWCENCDSERILILYRWQYYLQQLAISDNRIEYLWEEFYENI